MTIMVMWDHSQLDGQGRLVTRIIVCSQGNLGKNLKDGV